MRYPGVVAYRLPIDPALQARYDTESSGKVRDHVQCRFGVHTYRLVYPSSLDREMAERIRIAIQERLRNCDSHPSRIEDF
jgi:hypothetical protein